MRQLRQVYVDAGMTAKVFSVGPELKTISRDNGDYVCDHGNGSQTRIPANRVICECWGPDETNERAATRMAPPSGPDVEMESSTTIYESSITGGEHHGK